MSKFILRTAVVLACVVALGALARPAAAAEPATECPPAALAFLRKAMPNASAPTCHERRAGTQLESIAVDAVLGDGRLVTVTLAPDGTSILSTADAHGDLTGSAGKGSAMLFWLFALASVGGAVFVITRRNLIAAVMGMVGSFLGISAIYMLLYAQFLAVVQMLVYAGAIMVLFVFVVMILNRPEDEPVAPSGRVGQAIGGLAILYLVARLVLMLIAVQPPNPELAMAAPPPVPASSVPVPGKAAEYYDWGSVRAVGLDLFGPGLFPFEAISILLLVGVVGAIAIARPLHTDDDEPARVRESGAA